MSPPVQARKVGVDRELRHVYWRLPERWLRGAPWRIFASSVVPGDTLPRDASLLARDEAALGLPDQALELADQAGVLGVEPGDFGRALAVARLPPAGDAATRGADPLRVASRAARDGAR